MPSAAVTALRKASRGLFYVSEKDVPFTAFDWGVVARLTKKKMLELAGQPEESLVEEITLQDFFRSSLAEQKWHGAEEKAVVRRFQKLVTALQATLVDLRVYKIGQAKVHVVVAGKTADGHWAGLWTEALET